MDINFDCLPSTPIAIQVLFVCKSKIKVQNIIVRDHSERDYKNFSHLWICLLFQKLSMRTYNSIYIYKEA